MQQHAVIENQEEKQGPFFGRICQQREIEGQAFHAQDWRRQALDDFLAILRNDGFPCLFGRKAQKEASIRFLFCQQLQSGNYANFLSGLTQYTTFVRETPLADRLFAPLIIFFEEQFTGGLPQQHQIAWQALNWVHDRDPAAWPGSVPLDPEHPDWCFCFNGVQLFVNISSADHKLLRSRNLGRFLTLVINPRENFDEVASVHTRSGRLIRERIRSRIAEFNDGVVPSELGFYGDTDNREWQQYQLREEGVEKPAQCPFRKEIRFE
jgi:uncharacterized protein